MGILKHVLMVVLISGSVCAQRDWAGDSVYFELANEKGVLTQADDSYQLKWTYSDGVVEGATSITLPFDKCGQIAQDPGFPVRFLVGGRDSASGMGYVVSILLAGAPNRSMAIQSTVTLGAGVDPYSVYYNHAEGRLYYAEYNAKSIFSGVGVAPTTFELAADTTTCPDLVDHEMIAGPRNGVAGVQVVRPAGSYSHADWDVWHNGSGWMVSQVMVSAPAVPDTWSVERVVGHKGPIRVFGPVGPFEIVDVGSNTVVFSGAQSLMHQWEEHPVQSILPYFGPLVLRSVGAPVAEPTPYFSVTYRYGSVVTAGNCTMGKVRFSPEDLVASNDSFGVGTILFWDAVGPVPSSDAVISMNVAIEYPGQDPTTTFNGVVVLSNPIASYPLKEWPLNANSKAAAFRYEVDLAGSEGLTLLFQFVGVTPESNLIASDIGGGEVPAAAQALARTSGGTNAGSALSLAEKARAWARSQAQANTPEALAFRARCYRLLRGQ